MNEANQSSNSELEEIKFNFFTMLFSPIKEHANLNSNDIILRIVDAINQQRSNNNIIIFDRFKNRKNTPSRQLYISYTGYEPLERRLKFAMALIRSGKLPLLKPTGSIDLVPFDKNMGEFTEVTHFFIDMKRPTAVVCVEFNDNGPRMTDIEYYFRAMSTEYLHMSRSLTVGMMMEKNIDETLNGLLGVFDFDMKIESKKFSEMDHDTKGFLSEWGTLLTKLQPEFIRVEAFFQRKGKKNNTASTHPGLLTGLKHILNKLGKPNNADAFDKFVLNYEDKDGNAKRFDLFDTKSEISVMINLTSTIKTTDIYKLIKDGFDTFLKNRYNG
ncbi:hypothetical protein GWR56_15790 [Mucilaginibacter sp. 14171R-50]|uniref:hypothetical protein n=1 Tax=Mucilaginibacter sp. 14171R-50 TaxID=2703789 RepID=UPI00138B67E0|nr:hypothetical protein [Mucilaginibacter sp. 14171R-50]QHS56936.1 hypothetical protein GWR56_15790 [Mucilaginibacter sp. 14171R-50]